MDPENHAQEEVGLNHAARLCKHRVRAGRKDAAKVGNVGLSDLACLGRYAQHHRRLLLVCRQEVLIGLRGSFFIFSTLKNQFFTLFMGVMPIFGTCAPVHLDRFHFCSLQIFW